MYAQPRTIALLGQPNAGKSTLFNRLTGLHQHVGNWPGKTVEKKSGRFRRRGISYSIIDLPGTYSLSPGSMEEEVTRDFVLSGKADIIVMVLDASQLERSLYLMADYLGIRTPVVIALNMVDVAESKGKFLDHERIGRRINLPVVPVVAVRGQGMGMLMDHVEAAIKENRPPCAKALYAMYERDETLCFNRIAPLLGGMELGGPEWMVDKLMNRDRFAIKEVKKHLPMEKRIRLEAILSDLDPDSVKIRLARHKYQWIREKTQGLVTHTRDQGLLSGFDRIALHPVWGKILALFFVVSGLGASLALVSPLFFLTARVPWLSQQAADILTGLSAPEILISFVGSALIPAVSLALVLVLCVIGFVFVLGLMEDVGYLARMAFVFNNSMGRFCLHGKSIMPLVMGLTCNIAGVSASRVIDSWKQRSLTIIVSLVAPCLAVWSVISLISGIFFGSHALFIIMALLLTSVAHMFITSRIFSRILGIDGNEPGLVMELPPYHRPNFKTIFTRVLSTARGVFKKSLGMIVGVSVIIWGLSYSAEGIPQEPYFYKLGKWVEPVSLIFGMDWRLFFAFIISGLGKEAALGVIAMLFGAGSAAAGISGVMAGTEVTAFDAGALAQALTGASGITPAMALAFIFAYFLNIPCIAALTIVYSETRSLKLTMLTTAYYLGLALAAGAGVHRLALVFLN